MPPFVRIDLPTGVHEAPRGAAPPLAREFEARFTVGGQDLWTQWTALRRRAVRATPSISINSASSRWIRRGVLLLGLQVVSAQAVDRILGRDFS
jgi:hypothetical protein